MKASAMAPVAVTGPLTPGCCNHGLDADAAGIHVAPAMVVHVEQFLQALRRHAQRGMEMIRTGNGFSTTLNMSTRYGVCEGWE